MQTVISERFKKNLAQNIFLQGKRKIIVAASGGVDSMVLLHLLSQTRHEIMVAHVNYHLRGEESNEDEQLLKDFTQSLNLPFHKKDIPLLNGQQRGGQSIQMAARDLRYKWLEELRREMGYDWIATAHHSNDVAETFFLNLTAGCGIRGLHGIPLKRGNILRPILPFSKQDIYAYSRQEGLTYREDSSNLQNYYMRNFIRNRIIPLFEELNPQFIQTMQQNVQRIREAEELYNISLKQFTNQITKNDGDEIEINKNALMHLSFKKSILYELLKEYGFTSGQTDDIINAAEGSGKNFFSKSHRLIIDREKILLRPFSQGDLPGHYAITDQMQAIEVDYAFLRFDIIEPPQPIPNSSVVFYLDYDKLNFPLELRKWKHGDVFAPLGMKGRKKKVKEYFIDSKLNLFEKEDVWILTSQGQVTVLLGHRIDERYKISPKTTKVFKVTLIKK
jgi:tRNA(Ile)-lysidine synthase